MQFTDQQIGSELLVAKKQMNDIQFMENANKRRSLNNGLEFLRCNCSERMVVIVSLALSEFHRHNDCYLNNQ